MSSWKSEKIFPCIALYCKVNSEKYNTILLYLKIDRFCSNHIYIRL